LKSSKLRFTAAACWFLLVTILLCLPGTAFPQETWLSRIWFDKWVHLFLFFILVVLWCFAVQGNRIHGHRRKWLLFVAFAALVYGIGMEILQHFFVAYRSFETGDILADGLGSFGGYYYTVKKLSKN